MVPVLKAVGIRLAYGIPVFLLVTFIVGMFAELMPGSPGAAILGDQATQEAVDAINKRFGYDLPPFERYVNWLAGVVRLDFGETLFSREPVIELIGRRLAVTGELALLALFWSLVVSIPLALIAAMREGGIFDRAVTAISSAVIAIPGFVTVVILALIFTVTLRAFPATGWVAFTDDPLQNLKYAFLPALTLALTETAFFYRILRSELVGTLREDFVLVARAKGIPVPRIAVRHVLRPSFTSFVTVLGLSIGRLLGGAVIVEFFFAVPGIGGETLLAVSQKDMGVIQAVVALSVVVYVVLFIIVDLAYAWIDPRVTVK